MENKRTGIIQLGSQDDASQGDACPFPCHDYQ
jgi:hypothetical protein